MYLECIIKKSKSRKAINNTYNFFGNKVSKKRNDITT